MSQNLPDREAFWREFAQKHRPETVHMCRVLSEKYIEEYQFVELIKNGVHTKMAPWKARSIYRFLTTHGIIPPRP